MKKFFDSIFLVFFVAFLGLSHMVHHRNYNSYKQQIKLFSDLNGSYKNTQPEFYNNIETELPNLTISSVPLKALKAVYISENEPIDSIQKSLDLLHESIKDNPFLMFSEGNLSQIYYSMRKFDSAYYYARKSFKGLPNNAIHFAMLAKLYANNGTYDSIVNTFNKINIRPSEPISRIYFASMINFINIVDDSLKKGVIASAKKAKSLYHSNEQLQELTDYIIVGKREVELALEYETKGQNFLFEKQYKEGIELFEKALEIRKNNVGYTQTIGLAYHNIGEYDKTIEYLNKIEQLGIDLDPISLYIKGLSLYYIGNKSSACDYLMKASRYKQKNADKAHRVLCQ